jgi:ADP-heptose:LPS heptosyltransferase
MREYDEIIILHRDWRYGLIALAAGVRVRRGFNTDRGARFLTHGYNAGALEHHSEQYSGVAGVADVQSEGRWAFQDGELDAIAAKVERAPEADRPWIGLAFGGGHNVASRTTVKSWPIQSFIDLARRIEGEGYLPVWLGDVRDASLLPDDAPGISFAGKLTVAETAGVISRCRAVVSNDSMALHLADSLGIPSVGIFGPSEPQWTRPLRPGSSFVWAGADMPCSPCQRNGQYPPCAFNHRCMTELSVREVMDATRTAVASG